MIHGQKNIKLKHDVFDEKYFIILVLNFNTSGCLQSNYRGLLHQEWNGNLHLSPTLTIWRLTVTILLVPHS